MAFTISYVYQATDNFSPTIKKISKHLDALNKKLRRSGSQLKTTEGRLSSVRQTTRQVSNALTTANSRLQNMEGRTQAFNSRLSATSTRLRSATRQMRNLGQETRTSTARLTRASQALSSFGANVTMKAGVPLAAYSALSLKAFNTQAQALAKVKARLKATGGAAGLTLEQLTAEASRLQGITLFGDEETLSLATAPLLSFTNIAGEALLKAQRFAQDISAESGQGLRSSAVMLGKALNDPATGLSALTRIGIKFSDKHERVIKALAKSGRLAEAQAIIFEELKIQVGGTAEALADVGTGKLSQLGMAIGDFHEDVGKAIFETAGMKEMVISLTKWVVELNVSFQNFVKEHPKLTKFIAIFAGILIILGPVAFALAKIIIVAKVLAVVLGLAFAPMALTILGIAVAIAALVAAGWWIVENWDAIKEKTKALGLFLATHNPFEILLIAARKLMDKLPEGVKKLLGLSGPIVVPEVVTKASDAVGSTVKKQSPSMLSKFFSGGLGIEAARALGAGGSKNESVITVKLVDPQSNVGSVGVKHRGGNKPDVGVNLQQQ